MGNEYTNRQRDWVTEWGKLLNDRIRPLPTYYPAPDYARAFKVQVEGAPIQGLFHTLHEEVLPQVQYNNHPSVKENMDQVMINLRKRNFYRIMFTSSSFSMPSCMVL